MKSIIRSRKGEVTKLSGDNGVLIYNRLDSGAVVDMTLNDTGDVEPIINVQVPEEYVDDLVLILGANETHVLDFFDEESNIELQVGYDIQDTATIYFEVIDYDYSSNIRSHQTVYNLNISAMDDKIDVLDRLISFLKSVKRKESGKDELKFNNPQY